MRKINKVSIKLKHLFLLQETATLSFVDMLLGFFMYGRLCMKSLVKTHRATTV